MNEIRIMSELEESRLYWQKKLSDITISSGIQKNTALGVSNLLQISNFSLDHEISEKVKKICGNDPWALFAFKSAIIKIMLYKYTGEEDVVIKTAPIGDVTDKNLYLCDRVFSDTTFKTFLLSVAKTITEAYKHQEYSVEKIFNVNMDNTNDMLCLMSDDLHSASQICLSDDENNLLISVKYDYDIKLSIYYNLRDYSKDLIQNLFNWINTLIHQVVINPNILIVDMSLIDPSEEKKIIESINNADLVKEDTSSFQELFEKKVQVNGDKPALYFRRYINTPDINDQNPFNQIGDKKLTELYDDECLTYNQLNEKANQLAAYLIEKDVYQKVVGVFCERSTEMIISILAIIKAGGVYLPIDKELPLKRIAYMMEDSCMSFVLTDGVPEKQKHIFPEQSTILIKNLKLDGYSIYNPELSIGKHDGCYVIYTSGSSGEPKGVFIEHRGVINLQSYLNQDIGIGEGDIVALFAPICFDASVWEMTMSLLCGGLLHILNQRDIYDTECFYDYLNTFNISTMTMPPSYISELDPSRLPCLKRLISAGSPISNKLVQMWNKVSLINAYGPTEATVCVTAWKVDEKIDEYNSIPIGKPIRNNHVFILSKNDTLQPIGVPGELCVAGPGLSRGYINKPELTASRFYKWKGLTIYKTGDKARYMPDGNIEYIGRTDNQVKVRGYRIEIDEIEYHIAQHPSVLQTAVTCSDDQGGANMLIAFYTSCEDISREQWEKFLLSNLPQYMIPSRFIRLSSLTLNSRGKYDKKSMLNAYASSNLSTDKEDSVNKTIQKIRSLWKEILSLPTVEIDSDFFDVGGNSLLLMKMVSQINDIYPHRFKVGDIFSYSTIRMMAQYIDLNAELNT